MTERGRASRDELAGEKQNRQSRLRLRHSSDRIKFSSHSCDIGAGRIPGSLSVTYGVHRALDDNISGDVSCLRGCLEHVSLLIMMNPALVRPSKHNAMA